MTIDHKPRDLKDTAAAAAAAVKETAAVAADTAKEAGQKALDEARNRASDAASALRDGAAARADVARDTIADGGQRLAEGLREAAAAQGPGTFPARVLDTVAGGVATLSDQLRDRSLSAVMSDVQGFARRHPGAFVAGAAVAGFALARFTRASSRRPGRTEDRS